MLPGLCLQGGPSSSNVCVEVGRSFWDTLVGIRVTLISEGHLLPLPTRLCFLFAPSKSSLVKDSC